VTWREEAKRRAALAAVQHVKDDFVVGLGSGSTAAYVIEDWTPYQGRGHTDSGSSQLQSSYDGGGAVRGSLNDLRRTSIP